MGLSQMVKGLAKKIEFDSAVLFGLSAKIIITIAGPVTAVLIISHFSLSLQGYYYTFSSLLALQVFAEMGLGTVVQQFASHEWAKLSLGKDGAIIGDDDALSKLISLFKVAFKWFFVGGAITFLGLLIGGYIFFSTSPDHHIAWLAPWVCLTLLTGMNIMFVPFWSLLEGCNQVKSLYGFRVIQGLLLNSCIWISIIAGAGLWAICLGSIVSLISAFVFIRVRYLRFFKKLLTSPSSGNRLTWKGDLLPMQWRIAVSWISGYFCFSIFTPFLFKYHGPEIAGKFGMTWSIINALGAMGVAWVTPKVPQFAIYAAQKNYKDLNKILYKIAKIVFFILLFLSAFAWLFVYSLPFLKIGYANYLASRLISPLPFGLLLIAQLLLNLTAPFGFYLRAHKKEPLMYISVFQSLLVLIFTFTLSPKYSVLGIAIGYLISMLITIPMCFLVWHKYKKKWTAEYG
jgi:O-antigen/teichoic acid export membrane protein